MYKIEETEKTWMRGYVGTWLDSAFEGSIFYQLQRYNVNLFDGRINGI